MIIAQIENEISSVQHIPYFWTFRGRRIPPNIFFNIKENMCVINEQQSLHVKD